MNIKKTKKCFKICDVVLNKEKEHTLSLIVSPRFIDLSGDEHENSIYKENVCRNYVITENSEIAKIGQSGAKGGMKQTLEIYKTGGLGGKPSCRSIGTWLEMYLSLLNGNKIEIWMHYWKNVEVEESDFMGNKHKISVRPDPKQIESLDLKAFYQEEGCYPKWNHQERHEEWPQEVRTLEVECKKGKGNRDVETCLKEVLNNLGIELD